MLTWAVVVGLAVAAGVVAWARSRARYVYRMARPGETVEAVEAVEVSRDYIEQPSVDAPAYYAVERPSPKRPPAKRYSRTLCKPARRGGIGGRRDKREG